MALKTFNIDEKVYVKFAKHCKKEGISMSRRIENFIRTEIKKMIETDSTGAEFSGIGNIKKAEGIEHPLKRYC